MPIDPFAAVSALRSLQSYLDKMTREFSEKRKLLDGAITSVLFAWDCGFPAVAIAPLLDKARSAIATECPPVSASATGLEYDIAHILLTACENDTLTLLTQLFNVYPAEVVAVRHALARHAGRVLSAWCVDHADDYPARLRAEAQRLGITGSAFSEWCEKPQADEVAGALVFATEYGRTFEVGLIYDTPDLGAVAEGDPVVKQLPYDMPGLGAVASDDAFAALRAAVEMSKLKGNERTAVILLCDRGGRVPLSDVAFAFGWVVSHATSVTVFANQWTSLQSRLNGKLRKHGWRVSRHDNCVRVSQIPGVRK